MTLLFVAHDDCLVAPLAAAVGKRHGLECTSAGMRRGEPDMLWYDLLQDCGLDLSQHTPRMFSPDELQGIRDLVLLDSQAARECPSLPKGIRIWEAPPPIEPLADPWHIAQLIGHLERIALQFSPSREG